MMTDHRTLEITTPTDREIVMTRSFDAPRRLVYDAWTKPELLKRWLGVRNGWSFTVCEVDLRVGGRYRFVWRSTDGTDMGMGGVYREIVAPERLVSTEAFEDPWYPGEAIDTLELTEADGRTTVTTTVLYETKEIRDGVLASGMASGVGESYDQLDEVLASLS
jgi:uncharacterized protein YndB with AHSA1/START domain